MDIHVSLRGSTPYLMHNIQGVDPDLPLAREMKAITAKKSKMTEDDRRNVERIEWMLGTYLEDGALAVPVRNLKKCFIDSGKITRDGTAVTRALSFPGLHVPLEHAGNGSLDAMYKSGQFMSRLAVGIGKARTMRVRPQFMPWAITFDAVLFEDAMDFDTFTRVVERSGVAIGLGDNRTNGYGRFEGLVTKR